MRALKAFLARSFLQIDDQKIKPIEDLLESFSSLGLTVDTAERTDVESVSKKVRQKIDDCDVFVAVFTQRHPIYVEPGAQHGSPTPSTPVSWTAPPWLFQELGYALKGGKKLLLFLEPTVEVGGLQGDLEYIPYDFRNPQSFWLKGHQVLSTLVSQHAGIVRELLISAPEAGKKEDEEKSQESVIESVVVQKPISKSPLEQCFYELLDAAAAKNLGTIRRLEERGAELIQGGTSKDFDEVQWRCLCTLQCAKTGDITAIQRLHELSNKNPQRSEPLNFLALIARIFEEPKHAGDLWVKAATVDPSRHTYRISAAKSYRSAKLWDELGRSQLETVLRASNVSDTVKADALKEMFWGLKDAGDHVAAFCFAEAALSLVPNDSNFRFSLAYAYGDTTGGYRERDYRDLALFHYRVLGKEDPVVRNNLGVCYNQFEMPIHASEEFKGASEAGLPLGTANVVRQYLRSGFTSEAKAWAHEHVPSSDERGEVTQALSELHSHRLSEQGKLEAILKFESKHRLALANFVVAGLSSEAQNIQGRYRFPAFSLELTRLANSLTGTGETGSLSAKWTYRLTAHFEHRLWRFQIDSESIYSQNKSEGILAFSADGKKGMVLEYQPDGVIAHYMIFQELGNQTILAPSS